MWMYQPKNKNSTRLQIRLSSTRDETHLSKNSPRSRVLTTTKIYRLQRGTNIVVTRSYKTTRHCGGREIPPTAETSTRNDVRACNFTFTSRQLSRYTHNVLIRRHTYKIHMYMQDIRLSLSLHMFFFSPEQQPALLANKANLRTFVGLVHAQKLAKQQSKFVFRAIHAVQIRSYTVMITKMSVRCFHVCLIHIYKDCASLHTERGRI